LPQEKASPEGRTAATGLLCKRHGEGGRFPHAEQVFWTAFGALFLAIGAAVYRKKDEND
jgi:hypothetical protein